MIFSLKFEVYSGTSLGGIVFCLGSLTIENGSGITDYVSLIYILNFVLSEAVIFLLKLDL